MRQSQNTAVLAWLKRGRTLTALEALRRFGCLRLAARCHDLTRAGHPIVSEPVNIGGHRVARHRLAA